MLTKVRLNVMSKHNIKIEIFKYICCCYTFLFLMSGLIHPCKGIFMVILVTLKLKS